jgi:hypothetical protein
MTDDLVKRLHNFPMLEDSKLCSEAADRIEKLEAALRKIMNLGQSAVPDHWEARCLARDTARKALEGKDD